MLVMVVAVTFVAMDSWLFKDIKDVHFNRYILIADYV